MLFKKKSDNTKQRANFQGKSSFSSNKQYFTQTNNERNEVSLHYHEEQDTKKKSHTDLTANQNRVPWFFCMQLIEYSPHESCLDWSGWQQR